MQTKIDKICQAISTIILLALLAMMMLVSCRSVNKTTNSTTATKDSASETKVSGVEITTEKAAETTNEQGSKITYFGAPILLPNPCQNGTPSFFQPIDSVKEKTAKTATKYSYKNIFKAFNIFHRYNITTTYKVTERNVVKKANPWAINNWFWITIALFIWYNRYFIIGKFNK